MSAPMIHIDLFSGIGGFGLAAQWAGYRTAGFVEIDPWCQRVLAKHWPETPIHGDITTLTGDLVRDWARRAGNETLAHAPRRGDERSNIVSGAFHGSQRGDEAGSGTIDLITGGFPCQPFSLAGQRLGQEDDRALWPHMLRIITDVRPHRVLAENVAGLISMGLDAVLADLEALGYACGAVVVPAAAVGAPHRRDRVWILADAGDSERRTHMAGGRGDRRELGLSPERSEGADSPASHGRGAYVADAARIGEREPADQANAVATGGNARQEPRGGSFDVADSDPRRELLEGIGVVGAAARAVDRSALADDADAAARRLRRGWTSGHERQPAFGGEGDHDGQALSGLGIRPHGLSTRLDEFGGLDGQTESSGTGEALRGMRRTYDAQDVQRAIRGLGRVQSPEVLQSDVHGERICQRCAVRRHAASTGEEAPWDILRILWGYDAAASASQGLECAEQLAREHPDVVHLLSCLLPPPCSTCWGDGSWEINLPRTQEHEPDRVNKLKALGNAIVPSVAYAILNAWGEAA